MSVYPGSGSVARWPSGHDVDRAFAVYSGHDEGHRHELRRFERPDVAAPVRPALTTVHVDKVMMGVVGVRKLVERAETPGGSAMTTTISTQLIVRESVARIGDKPRR